MPSRQRSRNNLAGPKVPAKGTTAYDDAPKLGSEFRNIAISWHKNRMLLVERRKRCNSGGYQIAILEVYQAKIRAHGTVPYFRFGIHNMTARPTDTPSSFTCVSHTNTSSESDIWLADHLARLKRNSAHDRSVHRVLGSSSRQCMRLSHQGNRGRSGLLSSSQTGLKNRNHTMIGSPTVAHIGWAQLRRQQRLVTRVDRERRLDLLTMRSNQFWACARVAKALAAFNPRPTFTSR